MEIDSLDINWKNIEKLNKKSKERRALLKKVKMRGTIIKWIYMAAVLGTCIQSTSAYFTPLLKDNYNIYFDGKLKISNDEVAKIINNLEERLNKDIAIDEIDDYLLLDAVLRNKNLNEEEKQRFYKMTDIIKDNLYIDRQLAYKNLLNLDILYVGDRTDIAGTWSSLTYQIKLDDNLDGSVKDDVLDHEIIHSIFEYDYKSSKKLEFIAEGVCELLRLEYIDKEASFVKFYDSYIYLLKMLCEIVGSNTVLESYSKSDMSYIYNAMANIKATPSEAQELLEDLDEVVQQAYENRLDLEDRKTVTNVKEKLDKLNEYYNIKISKDNTVDVQALNSKNSAYYYNYNLLKYALFNEITLEEDLFNDNIYLHKKYFLPEEKKEKLFSVETNIIQK